MTILDRKNGHIDVVRSGAARSRASTGLDAVRFVHCALPEIDLGAVDLGVSFLGRPLAAPFMISSMTGGPDRAGRINAAIAEAAQACGIAMAVGSQRIALESGDAAGLSAQLRRAAPDIPIYANLGAAQLVAGWSGVHVRKAIDMIEADAIIIHLNPLQEALQSGGDTRWRGALEALERLCADSPKPVIVKEVGFGISGRVARRLLDAGVAAIDVAGTGGTSWAAVEGALSEDPVRARLAELYRDWGVPTAEALRQVRSVSANCPLIGSGGVRDGLDAARALRLGADIAGIAGGVLEAALTGPEAVIAAIGEWAQALRLACFATGSATISELKTAAILEPPAAVDDQGAGPR